MSTCNSVSMMYISCFCRLYDQFAFYPTGALVQFIRYASLMVEENSFVRCLLVDFYKAFDVVWLSILLSKISRLNIPLSILIGRTQVCRTPDGGLYASRPITSSIVQGYGIGPTLWNIMKNDLHQLSRVNIIFKYADDTDLLVPENKCHFSLWFNSGLLSCTVSEI